MSTDMLAHLSMGAFVMVYGLLCLAEAKHWLPTKLAGRLIGANMVVSGIFYYLLLSGFSRGNLTLFGTGDAVTLQHFLIAEITILIGIIALLFVRPVNLLARAGGLVAVGIILLLHAQGHAGGHAEWLTPYHRALAVLLFGAALCHVLAAFRKSEFWLSIAAVSLGIGGVMLLLYHDPVVAAVDCQSTPHTVAVSVGNGSFQPKVINAVQCDKLHFFASDDAPHIVAMGEHSHHQVYAGWTEGVIGQGKTADLTLSQTGTYELHDHLNDEVTATLIVKR